MPLPAEILNTLPEDIRGSEHIAAFNDVGSLVKDFIGAKTADWKAGLPDDLRADPSLTGFKAISELAKSFVETKKLVGQTLRPPAADASDDEWDKYYRAGGKPNAPEEYKFTMPDGALSKEEEKEIRDAAYRLGLNSRQAQKAVDMTIAERTQLRDAQQRELTETDKKYREKWGANFEKNKALVFRTIDRIDPEKKLRAFFDATGLGNHPVMIDLFHEWGKRLVEDGLMSGDVEGITSREEAAQKIKGIMADPKHAYHTSKMGEPAFEEMRKLHQLAYD